VGKINKNESKKGSTYYITTFKLSLNFIEQHFNKFNKSSHNAAIGKKSTGTYLPLDGALVHAQNGTISHWVESNILYKLEWLPLLQQTFLTLNAASKLQADVGYNPINSFRYFIYRAPLSHSIVKR
jgi:hypothetical protein